MNRSSLLSLSLFVAVAPYTYAQSTLGSISGTVQDKDGGHVPNATVRIHRADNNSDRTLTTDSNGTYNTLNLEPGLYDITVEATGLAATTATGVTLQARQQLRYDITLKTGTVNETVTVSATDAGVINLENAQISAALTPQAVLDLPANYRGAGSTSPLNVVQALPGRAARQCELSSGAVDTSCSGRAVLNPGRTAITDRGNRRRHFCAEPDK